MRSDKLRRLKKYKMSKKIQKTKKLRKLRKKSRIKGSKRKKIYHRTRRKINSGGGMEEPDITLYRTFNHNGKLSGKEISSRELTIMNSSRIGGWSIEEPATIEKIRNYYLSQEGIESCDVKIIYTLKGKLRIINNNDTKDSYAILSVIPFIKWEYWNNFGSIRIIFNIGIIDYVLEAELAKLEKELVAAEAEGR